jgi:uncharacterized membrane protein YebE (DUF533 family)
MFNADKMLGQLLGSPAAAGFAGGLAGGMLTSKGGRKLGKKALQYGSIAAVGALAYNAYRNHQQGKAATPGAAAAQPQVQPAAPAQSYAPPPADSGFAPAVGTEEANHTGMLIIRAMIAAARADGKLDGDEMNKVLEQADQTDLDPESRARLLQELRAPVDMDQLVAGATTEELKVEVYLASLLAIEVDTEVEKAYLAMLKARLGLDSDLVARLHEQVEMV